MTAELTPLQPPAAPEQTHREERPRLPTFPEGEPATRLSRARDFLADCARHVEGRHRAGISGLSACRLLSESSDRLVRGLFDELFGEHSLPPGPCLLALGGYGRRELAPHSDLDLLLLRPEACASARLEPFARALSTLLWDLKRALGWSVRTVEETSRAAAADHTLRTALLDRRLLAGDRAEADALDDAVQASLQGAGAAELIADKTAELKARREKFGDSIFLLEPNLKAGEGGLRDLETALWIARARYGTRGLSGLLARSALPASEVATLQAARDFLLRVRNELHYLRGRKEDRLTFDLQEAAARSLGYREGPEGLPVEQFMRHYYLSAKAIRRAVDALIDRVEAADATPRAGVAQGPFEIEQGRLVLEGGEAVLRKTPERVLHLFQAAEEGGLALHFSTRDQVAAALPHLAAARESEAVSAALKALFLRQGSRGDFLPALHDCGALGAVVPEFGRVTALHQHDLYHLYTVDVHSVFAVRKLYSLRAGDLDDEQPGLARLMQALLDPLPLYLGMLLHDCGKGLGGGHAERGEALSRQVTSRLGLDPRQRELTAFLVREHLLMSHTAQRRDLSDPALIETFARACGDLERLTCLYLLSFADISSVAPQMWTPWKGQLLAELYAKACARLGGGPVPETAAVPDPRLPFESRWERAFGAARARALAEALPERYFLSTAPTSATLHGRLLLRAREAPLAAAMTQLEGEPASEIAIAAADRHGLLATLAGVLAAHRIDILRARIVSTRGGQALDLFDVHETSGARLDRARWRAARADLFRALEGGLSVEALLERRHPRSPFARAEPAVRTRVAVDNRASRQFTVIDVRARDRVGLLHALAAAMSAGGLEISLAKISTEANEAHDAFYVTREGRKVTEPAEVADLAERVQRAVDAFLQRPG